MSEQYAEMITGFPLFEGFTVHGTKRLLDAGEVKEHAAGSVLLKEGEAATFVLLVLAGKLEVFVERDEKDLILTETKPGAILGELAVLCGIPRSASVRAKENSAVLQWSDDAFRRLLLRDPSLSQRIFREALRTLIEKERSLIDSVVDAQDEANKSYSADS
jgi:CRP-like cAMP-binding protein